MILIDFTQTIIAGLMAQLKMNDGEVSEDLLRHMILNSVRNYQKRYGGDYGQIVLCTDAANPWRRDFFPQYKANRKKVVMHLIWIGSLSLIHSTLLRWKSKRTFRTSICT